VVLLDLVEYLMTRYGLKSLSHRRVLMDCQFCGHDGYDEDRLSEPDNGQGRYTFSPVYSHLNLALLNSSS
jgi:hypothetical protein